MFGKSLALLATGAVLSLGACHRQPPGAAGTAAPVAAPQAFAVPTSGASTPTISLAPGTTTVTVKPVATPCGAEKLFNYVNLLPTSTAKSEIARTVGNHDIRYVPMKPPPATSDPERLTAELGVDGRIKKFVCG